MPERSSIDEIIDIYKRDVDRTLLRENLKLTPTERVRKLQDILETFEKLQNAKKRKLTKDDSV
ncbi:MAG: hypothetical protein H7A23_16265 [Leptospiraceae bacterium]|nr:hypothetical protein [Leptospiraceae bacterium]MCP5496102.1 hypothetical protein [Leptospiraceae bacterium]